MKYPQKLTPMSQLNTYRKDANTYEDVSTHIDKNIERFKYAPYEMEDAVEHWQDIARGVMNKPVRNKKQFETWKQLIKYCQGDETFEGDLKKTILLIGNTGTGKTKTMEMLNKFIEIDNVEYKRGGIKMTFGFKVVSARDIGSAFGIDGYEGIEKYKTIGNLCIDDLGSEADILNHYGSKLDVMTDIIETRYSKGLFTHFTSNLTIEQILDRYNSRVHSRIMHTCNIIIMSDKDFRIQN